MTFKILVKLISSDTSSFNAYIPNKNIINMTVDSIFIAQFRLNYTNLLTTFILNINTDLLIVNYFELYIIFVCINLRVVSLHFFLNFSLYSIKNIQHTYPGLKCKCNVFLCHSLNIYWFKILLKLHKTNSYEIKANERKKYS